MTEPAPEGEVPVHEGPEPREWPEAAPAMWGKVLNVEALTRILEAVEGAVVADLGPEVAEARSFLRASLDSERGELSAMILRAYHVELPQDPELPTEAVGGFRGDSDRPGNRDHV